MKFIVSAAFAAILTTALPAQAAEEFGVAFAAPVVKESARQVKPGDQLTLRLNVVGKATTLTIVGPKGWQQDEKNVSGEFKSWPFAVTNVTPAGLLKFTVTAKSATGKTIEDTIEFLNVGGDASGQQVNISASNDKTAADTSRDAQALPSATATAQPQNNNLSGLEARVEGNLFTAPMSFHGKQQDGITPWSNNAGTFDVRLQVKDSPLFVGLQLRSAPEDSTANVNGDKGAAAYGGLHFQPDASISADIKIGLNRDDSGRPLYASIRAQGNPWVERFAQDFQVSTNLGFASIGYNGGVRFLGTTDNARAEVAAGGQYRHDFPSNASHPSIWMGLRGITPIDPTLWRGEIRFTLGYLLPVAGWDGKSQYPDGALIGLELLPLVAKNTTNQPQPTSDGRTVKAI